MEELLTGTLAEVIEAIKNIAPLAWEMTVRQVYVTATVDAIVGAFFLALAVMFVRFGNWATKKYSDSYEYEGLNAFLYAMAGASVLVVVVEAAYVAGYLINPNWYAVKLLLSMAK